ncbi:hypothetical protein [Glutamicibacter ardleyensis]|uniref:PspA/IM30 family protein n=1 Tax=Glutamicibacter ardleyensis TaxID=225894 RepID=A0ABQ2DHT9_9MICC|nr:hypothetical protein [Glutamicibacter ardleyensis]GGJ56136.1 hypothetical protein GCM10007173_13670 [Glutamicibacter ardleyensis]
MTTQPLTGFLSERQKRVEIQERLLEARRAVGRAQILANQIVREAQALQARTLADTETHKQQILRDAHMEARDIVRDANDKSARANVLLKNTEARTQTMLKQASKRVEDSKTKRANIISGAYEQKRRILTTAKAATGDIDLLYATTDQDCQRIRRLARVEAEKEVKLIREKARNEGLAMADVELDRRVMRDLNLAKVRG